MNDEKKTKVRVFGKVFELGEARPRDVSIPVGRERLRVRFYRYGYGKIECGVEIEHMRTRIRAQACSATWARALRNAARAFAKRPEKERARNAKAFKALHASNAEIRDLVAALRSVRDVAKEKCR